jgi:hypothetical protein
MNCQCAHFPPTMGQQVDQRRHSFATSHFRQNAERAPLTLLIIATQIRNQPLKFPSFVHTFPVASLS